MAAIDSPRSGGRRNRVKKDSGGGWITTYADAVTILMAFFVILYAMSEIDVIKFTAFVEGLRVPFGNESGEGLLPQTDGLQPDQPPPSPITGDVHRRDAPSDLDPDERDPADDADHEPQEDVDPLEALERHTQAQDQLDQVALALNEALEEFDLDLLVEMRREERGLVVSIASDDVLFALGSTEIDGVGLEVIEVVAQTLDGFPNPLLVEGHTDNLPLNRGGYTNWNLSTDRAVAVLQLMIEEHELASDRVGAAGYSEYHPLDDNATAAGRARNRRVDIVVLLDEQSLSTTGRAATGETVTTDGTDTIDGSTEEAA
jgi:chemotaxis protein MotB